MIHSPPAPKDHPGFENGKTGILLINLGTPDATSYWPMRRYLKEFLSDPRVVEANRVVWWFILNGIILGRRPQKSGAAYEQIWNQERDESPLKTITRAQRDKLAEKFAGNKNIMVDWAMRYGSPSIGERLTGLKDRGCERVLIAPLYPQYSAATTATAMDKVFETLQELRWQPVVRTLPPYFDQPSYISALTTSLTSHLGKLNWKPDMILASFHGLPVKFVENGDPYQLHCQKTVKLLQEDLAMDENYLRLTFQSRTNRQVWLDPYTEDEVVKLARAGGKNLLILTPGFSADCLETLEEIAIRAKKSFLENGGSNFSVLPCLNDSPGSISMLRALLQQELGAWT